MAISVPGVYARWAAAAFVTVSIVLTATMAAAQAPAGRKLAVVVGNDTYPASPLVNARNDARAMAATLREVGFTVMLLEDATRNQMVARLAELSETLRADDVAFFFYSGHGLQMEGENYLVPSDFEGTSATAVRLTTLPVSEIQAALGRAKVSVLVLDACRSNPYSATRAAGLGLAAMEARGSIIAFATGAGQTASDNRAGANGLFTQHLLTALREPNLPLREIFYRTRQRVYEASNGRQFPAVYDGLLGEMVLRPGAGGIAPAPTYSAAPPPAFAAPAPAAAAPPSSSSTGVTIELLHMRQSANPLTGLAFDGGTLTISPGRVRWSETGEVLAQGGPNKERKQRGDRDDFDATCADIESVQKIRKIDKEDRWFGGIRIGGRNYDFYAIELKKGKLDYVYPRPSVLEAIRAACPNVEVR